MEANEVFGLTKEETAKLKDFKPTLNLGNLKVNESVRLQILDDKPREVEVDDQKTKGAKKKELVIEAVDKSNGLQVTVWLSAKSLRMEFLKIYTKNNTLKNKHVIVGVREYDHPKYKKVKAYTVQEDANKE